MHAYIKLNSPHSPAMPSMELIRSVLLTITAVYSLLIQVPAIQAGYEGLSPDYYSESCPLAEEIVRQNVEAAVYQDPTIAAALLRLHFHDCFVLGCDASVLLDDAGDIVSEKNAVPNLNSLRGFQIVDQIKAVLEYACPLTVSCADLLAIAARDAVHIRGGPSWEVSLGRRDSLKASLNEANDMIPAPNFTLHQLISNFKSHGLDIVDLVTLSGSHTIGRSRCVSFKGRLYSEQAHEAQSYYYDQIYEFQRSLRSVCPASGRDNDVVPLDFETSRRFDNQYFLNLLQGKGLLQSDNELVYNEETEESVMLLVWEYAANQELFFREFVNSIVKMGNINVLVGDEGEIRRNCRYLNV